MKKVILPLLLILSFIQISQAQNYSEIIKVTASDAAASDYCGYSVSVSGDYAIVGAYGNDDNGSFSGSAYIYKKDQGGTDNWGEVKKIIGSNLGTDDYFGYDVSISGDYAIVGAYGDDDNGSSAGAVYIYEKDQGGVDNWGEVKKITASDGAATDFFGQKISISGDYIIIGVYGNDDHGYNSGSAYIYGKDQGGTDNWGEVKKITASDAAPVDYFGVAVSISGNYAIIGSLLDDDNVDGSGSVYVYYKDQGGIDNWGEVKKITASDAAAGNQFGYSVSISGDYFIVGAYLSSIAAGSGYIYYKDQGGTDNWGEVKKITASDAASNDQFGFDVSISGDYAILGAYLDDDDGSSSGSAYIYQNAGALPVELTYFNGRKLAEGNQLAWETASEKNNKGFEVQKSQDGKNWETLDFVSGNGTIITTQNYSYLDKNPTMGNNYYRLKQMDFDGVFEYSNIISLNYDASSTNKNLNIYPNPVRNELTILDGQGQATIYNLLGQAVNTLIINNEQLTIDVSNLEKGQYILSIQRENGEITMKKFVK